MTYDLNSKVVLITGAAGGIGAATARELYARGASLVLTDLQQSAVDHLAQEFDAERVLPLALDVTDADATKAVVRKTIERFERLDVAFANAGISWRGTPGTIMGCDEQEFEHIVEVDLFGVWRTIRAALPEVVRNEGQILVTSSVYSFLNGVANAPYAASKAAVEMLTRSLQVELGGSRATASVVYPGWTATAIAKVAFGGNELATRMNETALPNFLRRPIQPEQMAKAIVMGIESRSTRIIAPGRWAPISLLRGMFNAVTDWTLRRDERFQGLLRELETQQPGKS
ncbi:putative short-chain type dehydrogenase/reductase [compost metagenome]|jgi:NAD(P)-dependent dehydrogenase (short-subunit alcohol dehydrogenase family)|uniref:SDR family NAD(P)-dependent oxidoreductase n=1 Tax=Pseudomonas chlororaphis TaxID=587753 RepID=UPI000FBB7933|nr:SDR family NAD(P)-dependent oxidoreductase [Pseudomonas chlororaphis]QHC91628.1 short-chain dehydrogenase [Pseudomonas chlororaphis]